jgi:hypothetical protein
MTQQPEPTCAREMVPRSRHALFDGRFAARDWVEVMSLVGSHQRFAFLELLWGEVDDYTDQRALLTQALAMGDLPSNSHSFLITALNAVRFNDDRIFDSDAARERFEALRESVTIYRGTVEAERESRAWGIAWTINPERAEFFAIKHHRFRNLSSDPIILSIEVPRDDLAGMLIEHNEDEVLFIGDLDEARLSVVKLTKSVGKEGAQ